MQPTFPRELLRATSAVLAGLLLGCLIVGIGFSFFIAGPQTPLFPTALLQSLSIAGIAAAFGFPLCIAYGLPAYSLLLFTGRATYLSALAAGALPALMLAFIERENWRLYGPFFITVALATHFCAKRFGCFAQA